MLFESKKAGTWRQEHCRGACDRGASCKKMKQKDLLAKLQTEGIEISTPALSLLEGQKRPVMDYELNASADILGVSVDWLLGRADR